MYQSFLIYVFSFLLLALMSEASSQNIVVNGDFSTYYRCPQTYNKYNQNNLNDLLPGWKTVNKSTPDFFHRCSQSKDAGVPENFAGLAEPFSGEGYMGIILRVDEETYPFSATYSEHITGVLEFPLKKNKSYCFTMYYRLAQNSGIETNSIGVYFSNSLPEFEDNDNTYSFHPQLILHSDSNLASLPVWNKLSGIYTASGGEKYLTIGNFLPLSLTRSVKKKPAVYNDTRYFAYYYIDAVSVVESDDCTEQNNALIYIPGNVAGTNYDTAQRPDPVFAEGMTYTLQNVYFDFEKSVLRPESFPELDKITGFLKQHLSIHIRITGHTDNVGTNSYNQMLSEARARAVFEYFYTSGISLRRMAYSGKGNQIPIADNDTEYGRQQNRRVEIEFFIP